MTDPPRPPPADQPGDQPADAERPIGQYPPPPGAASSWAPPTGQPAAPWPPHPQPHPYGQYGPYAQPGPYGRPGEHGQPSPWARPGPWAQPGPWAPPSPADQHGPWGQQDPWGRPAGWQQPGPWGQPPAPQRRSRLPRVLGLLVLALVVVAGAVAVPLALRSTALDPQAVQRDVASQYQQLRGTGVELRCAQDMTVQVGSTYRCTGTTDTKESVRITIRITGRTGAYTWSD